MILFFLACCRLMAVEAVHALFGMHAQLVFVNDGNLLARMALGAFARGAHEGGARLFDLNRRAFRVDELGA
jgi:hypothetical protein